jgi:HK97 family phage portal protein
MDAAIEEMDEKYSELVDVGMVAEGYSKPAPEQYKDYNNAYSVESWAYVCVTRIAWAIGTLPLKLYRRTTRMDDETGKPIDDKEEVTEHPALVWVHPNPFTTKSSFWQSVVSYLEISGNAYIEQVLDAGDKKWPTELYVIDSNRMDVIPHKRRGVGGYKWKPDTGQPKILPVEKIRHLKYFNPGDDFYGLGPMQAASVCVTGDLFAQAHMQQFFKQGARPSVLFTTDKKLNPKSIRNIKMQIKTMYQGVRRAWLPIVLHSGLKLYEFGTSNKDAEFMGLRKLSREEICAIFGVPPSVAGIYEYANYANAYAQKEIFYMETIRPKLEMLEDMLNEELRRHGEKDLFFEFLMDDVLRADTKTRYEAYKIAIEEGFMTQNHAAQIENLPQVPWGNSWFMPLNKAEVKVAMRQAEADVALTEAETETEKNPPQPALPFGGGDGDEGGKDDED